ncbi:SGNH/GDSL hydrolase family protein [Leifsonia sp. NCR5]|uniref:SGNH/GDSL hydrolase family protein n=1 Tax=Leifsonia sp. NCR5 TaxID=1978342 RepID=UPI00117AB6AB|nr:SGNH/GDSL hydrolase family protein [Leifsonia sp. NCR5]
MRLSTRGLRVALLAAATAVAVVLTGCTAAAPQEPVAGQRSAAAPQVAERPVAVAIGDSIAFGKGIQQDQAWPALVAKVHDWRLTDLAVSGSGFLHPGWNGTTFQQQVDQAVALKPSYILIAATRNDRLEDPAALAQKSTELVGALRSAFPRAHIIGVTAIWGSDQPPATITMVDDAFRSAVEDVDGTFVDIGFPLVGHPEWLQADGIHPNPAGQEIVAKAIETKLAPKSLAL